MSTLKVNTINAATSGQAVAVDVQNPRSNRNLMINGDMQVAQRGTSDTSTTQGYTTVDRWTVIWTGLDETLSRYQTSLSSSDTGPWEKGFRKAWRIKNGNQTGGAGAADTIIPQYTVEAQDLANSGWNPADPDSKLTLSFWVKSTVAQTFYSYVYVSDGGGDSYAFSYALSANTWTKVTKTIPGHADLAVNSDNGAGMTIYLPLFLGTDKTTSGHTLNQWQSWSSTNATPDHTSTWYTTNDADWYMTGIQLEVGSYATEFEHRSYAEELRRCQRYYHKNTTAPSGMFITDNADSTLAYGTCNFPVTMRVAPTVLVTSDNNGNTDGKVTQHGEAHNIAATPGQITQYGFCRLTRGSGNWSTNSARPIVAGIRDASAEF